MSKLFVYLLCHPDSLSVYVGKSSSGLERPRSHRSPSNLKRKVPVAYWVNKLLSHGKMYEIVILEQCADRVALADAERFYIAYFRTIGMHLLNLTDGGEGASRKKSTAEIAAIVARFKGKPLSAEHRAKLSAAAKRRYSDPTARARLISYGREMSSATRAKMSAAHRGSKYTTAQYEAQREHWKTLADSRRGVPRSPTIVAKIAAALRNPSPERRAKMCAAQQNRSPISDETRARMSAAQRNRSRSDAQRQHIRSLGIAHKGIPRSDATKKKLSVAHRGKKLSSSHRANIIKALTGRAVSTETRAKIGAANRKRWLTKMRINLLSVGGQS